ncbi:MAG: TIGR01777 family protein [Dehalococcoidia bacterium]|nr:MAG: TIGR01777 family protein [Dehalococcoidia bacterium]
MRIAITGATGLVGSALADYLEGAGHEVYRVRRGRSQDRLADWNPALGWIRPGALDGLDAVVHLAGEPIAGTSILSARWTPAMRERLRTSRVDATRLLIGHLATLPHPPRAFVAASAIGFYGNRGDERLTEDSPHGGGFLAGLVRDWERASLSARQAGMRTVLLRFGHVLSSKGGVLSRMLPTFRLGLGARFGNGRQYFSWVAVEDVVRAVEFALSTEIDGTLNVTAPEPVTNAEFAKALGRALHRPAVFAVPPFALRALIGPGADELLLWGQRVLPARLLAAGFEFRHKDVDEALRATFGR